MKISQVAKLSLVLLITPFLHSCSKQLSRENAEEAIKAKFNLPNNQIENFQFSQIQKVKVIVPFHYAAEMKKVPDKNYYGGTTIRIPDDIGKQMIKERNEAVSNFKFTPQKLSTFEALEKEGLITYSIELQNIVPGSDINQLYNIQIGHYEYYPWRWTLTDVPCTAVVSHVATPTEKGKKFILNNNQVIVASYEFGEVTGIVEMKEVNSAEVNYTMRRTNITPFGRILFSTVEETYNKAATFTKYDDGWRIEN